MVVEVTRQNFKDLYPKIEHAIRKADFIAIDTEFSGLAYDDSCKPSLFDSSSERYRKLKKSVQKFTVSQIGVSTFHGTPTGSIYSFSVETFLFHVFPTSFGANDQRFCLQASCVEFLCRHKFDFNKWLYEGIPYLNIPQEEQLKEELDNGMFESAMERCIDERHIQSVCSKVAAWIPQSKVGDFLNLPISSDIPPYVLHNDLRKRFPQIWTSINPFEQFVVERVTSEQREILEKEGTETTSCHKERCMEEMLGFTRVFRLLQQERKPIVGHNMWMDLLFLYEKFHKPLPESYEVFKKEIHQMFPLVYDTKHMSYQAKKSLECLQNSWPVNLKDLYDLLNSKFVKNTALCQPSIRIEGDPHKVLVHQAGYDSYLCGSVFLRLCHLLYAQKSSAMDMTGCPFRSYLPFVRSHCNCINVIRAVVNHLRLDSIDPPSERPPLLFVTSEGSDLKLSPELLASWFSVHGTVDIELMSKTRAIVATSSYAVARDILYAFQGHDKIKVTKYRYWQHSRTAQLVWWGSLTIATVTGLVLLYKTVR